MPIVICRGWGAPLASSTCTVAGPPSAALATAVTGTSRTPLAWARTMKTWAVIWIFSAWSALAMSNRTSKKTTLLTGWR